MNSFDNMDKRTSDQRMEDGGETTFLLFCFFLQFIVRAKNWIIYDMLYIVN